MWPNIRGWSISMVMSLALPACTIPFVAVAGEPAKAPAEAPAPPVDASADLPATETDVLPAAESPAPVASPAARAGRRVSPMFAEILDVLEIERVALAELHDRFARAANPAAALEVQREIERLKQGTEIALLRIQAVHARREGRVGAALRIEAAIVELTQPRVQPAREHAVRPASPSGR